MAWNVIAFESKRGEKFVENVIKSLDAKTIAKIGNEIDLLERHGPILGMPHAKKLARELHELRIRGKQEIRIIYCYIQNNIYLLHAFKKKTQKTPQKEVKIALRRLESVELKP